jgi:hypothetical protein
MNKYACITFFLAISMQGSYSFAGDIFDKAESAKDCFVNNNCKGHKWLSRFKGLEKCQKEGNCAEKAIESANKNMDKIQGAASKVNTFGNCMNTTDPDELKKCYDIVKTHHRDKQAKKEKAASALQERAYERKTQGDAVCHSGKLAFGLVKARVKGFVEQVSGDKIQIRIADTQGQDISYQGVSLRQNTFIWDIPSNWTHCKYLK